MRRGAWRVYRCASAVRLPWAHAAQIIMARLSTHVLDTANGSPTAGIRVRLYGSAAPNPGKNLRDNLAAPTRAPGASLRAGGDASSFSVADYFFQILNEASHTA